MLPSGPPCWPLRSMASASCRARCALPLAGGPTRRRGPCTAAAAAARSGDAVFWPSTAAMRLLCVSAPAAAPSGCPGATLAPAHGCCCSGWTWVSSMKAQVSRRSTLLYSCSFSSRQYHSTAATASSLLPLPSPPSSLGGAAAAAACCCNASAAASSPAVCRTAGSTAPSFWAAADSSWAGT